MQQLLYLVLWLCSLKTTTKVSAQEFYSWTHQQHSNKKCHCGKFASIGYPYRFGMLELLCYEHYKERINQCHSSKDIVKNQSAKTSEQKSKQVNQENKQSLLL